MTYFLSAFVTELGCCCFLYIYLSIHLFISNREVNSHDIVFVLFCVAVFLFLAVYSCVWLLLGVCVLSFVSFSSVLGFNSHLHAALCTPPTYLTFYQRNCLYIDLPFGLYVCLSECLLVCLSERPSLLNSLLYP